MSDNVLASLKDLPTSLPQAWAFTLLRTWANGWATTQRMHSAEVLARPCCGKEAGDDLRHYVRCEPFFMLADEAALPLTEHRTPQLPSVAEILMMGPVSMAKAAILVAMHITFTVLTKGGAPRAPC